MRFSPQYKPGQVVASFSDRRLYLVTRPGEAISYPIAIPRQQSRWQGVMPVTDKRVNPSWTPTPTMIAENPRLPRWVPGGHPMNPLGVRALYLGSSAYRIHGTDAPWTIGQPVSKGCIRMYNKDVIDLYNRVRDRRQGHRHLAELRRRLDDLTSRPAIERMQTKRAAHEPPFSCIVMRRPKRRAQLLTTSRGRPANAVSMTRALLADGIAGLAAGGASIARSSCSTRSVSWKLSSISARRLAGSASNWALWLGRPLPPIFRRARLACASCAVISPFLRLRRISSHEASSSSRVVSRMLSVA